MLDCQNDAEVICYIFARTKHPDKTPVVLINCELEKRKVNVDGLL